jgi:phospholipase C
MIRKPGDHSSKLGRGEGADPAENERFEREDGDGYMRRREFVARTASLAGAAGLGTVVPIDTLIAEAANRGRHHLPDPRNIPIDTFVVLMMENRSFDHYFGWHPHADARNTGLSYPDENHQKVKTHRLGNEYQGCAFRDPNHSWDGGRYQYNHGKMNGFVRGTKDGTGSDSFAAGYYLKKDLPFIPHVADAYTLYDQWHCSIMDSTYPNRHYQWGAQDGGTMGNQLPPNFTTGYQWETIFDRALGQGLTAKYYSSDIPFSALYGTRGIGWNHPVSNFYADAAAGTLPNIAFVDPAFNGEDQGTSGDEHPHGDVRVGQAFMSDVVHAFMESPQYRRGALFVDYDEWGGFFEHVKPMRVKDNRADHQHPSRDWGLTGFRVPGVAVSPFTLHKGVNHMKLTHESILKFIAYRFKLGHLNKRHKYATNIGHSFDFKKPHYDPPSLPDPATVTATPCTGKAVGEAGAVRAKPHDMEKLESSGLLDALGYEAPAPTLDRLFRSPGAIRDGLKKGDSAR